VKPFDGWSNTTPPLSWYDAYNQVKHNRNTEFMRANLDNVRHAIAGQFALLAVIGVIAKERGYHEPADKRGIAREGVYPGYIFSLVK
jgi:DNA-binding phage protein